MGSKIRKKFAAAHAVTSVVVLTFLMEAFTVLMRFGYQLESTRDTRSLIGPLTFGIRIHHCYLGLVLLCFAAALVWGIRKPLTRLALILGVCGASLLFSDLVHHFLVLWPLTGSPQFDLRY